MEGRPFQMRFRGVGSRSAWGIPALIFWLCGGSLLPLEGAEYLAADKPIPDSLAERLSPIESIGLAPEEPESEHSIFALPGKIFSGWGDESRFETGFSGIDDAEVSVQPRTYYRYRNNNGESVDNLAATGGALTMKSGWMADGFRVVLVGYTSQKLFAAAGSGGGGLLQPDGGGITVLGQAFAELKYWESSLVFGRMPLELPYINGNDTRMIPNTFEGATLQSSAVQNLKMGIGYLSAIKPRDAVSFVSMSEHAGAAGSNEGVGLVGFRYDLSEDANLGAINFLGVNTFNTFYLEGEQTVRWSEEMSVELGGQFTDQRSVGSELLGSFSTQSAGARAAFGYGGLIASVSFTWTAPGAGLRKPWGGSPSFNSIMISDFDRAGEAAIRSSLSMDFSDFGLKGFSAAANWVWGDTPESGAAASPDQQELNITLDFVPPVKVLEPLWIRFRYAENHMSNGYDRREFRVVLNYSYTF